MLYYTQEYDDEIKNGMSRMQTEMNELHSQMDGNALNKALGNSFICTCMQCMHCALMKVVLKNLTNISI